MKTTQELPQFVRDLLASPPKAGEGVNLWLFRMARVLHACRTETAILDTLRAVTVGCGRVVTEKEIRRAVQRSRAVAWTPGESNHVSSTPPWPSLNLEQRDAILEEGGGLVDLWEASPIRIDENKPRTEEIIDALFPGNPLICCGANMADFATQPREDWRGELGSLQLIVPSPMIARTGLTQEGNESEHTLEATDSRRFLVVEFDTGGIDEHAALLRHLAEYAPMVIAVHSGKKSLHGWFYCFGQPEARLGAFMRHAVTLGADKATWSRSQFVRMPDGTRNNGNRQAVYFFSPEVIR